MKLEKLSAWAEIVSSIAIVLSLIFVGIEVNRNTAVAKASAYQSVVEATHDNITTLVTNLDLLELVLMSDSEKEQLDPLQRNRLFIWDRAAWRLRENAFVQNQRGVLVDGEWTAYRYFLCDGTLNSLWEDHRPFLSPDFVEFIENCRE